MSDLVSCLSCGLQMSRLATHLKSHGLNAVSYRALYGPEVPLTSPASEEKRRAAIKASRSSSSSYNVLKTVGCTLCSSAYEAHKAAAPGLCPGCKVLQEGARWAGKTEPQDYVTCLDCGYRAENLTSHITSMHPNYRSAHSDALIVALGSSIRDKTSLQGRVLTEETKALMSENAGRWNAGLTKEAHPSIAAQSKKMQGRTPWSKGQTVSTDARLQATAEKLKLYIGENRPWHNGLRADLLLSDFAPILDPEGRVDRLRAVKLLGFSWNTIGKYMETYGLEVSDVNIKARSEAQFIRLTEEDLYPYRLGNGKLVVAWAATRLGYGHETIAREADRLGLPRLSHVQQGRCLGAVCGALEGADFQEEWRDARFTNPLTGHRFKFDGYFPAEKLVVEYHGYQHFVYPNVYHKTEEAYLMSRERDRLKREYILNAPGLTYLEIRYDEPFDDQSYLLGRLHALGIR